MSELPDWDNVNNTEKAVDKLIFKNYGNGVTYVNPAPDAAIGTLPFKSYDMIVGPNQYPYGPLPPIKVDHEKIENVFAESIKKMKDDPVNNPSHYGGADNPYEAIKVLEAWNLNFNLGNTLKYISRAGKKDDILQDLKKARWYLDREIQNLEKKLIG